MLLVNLFVIALNTVVCVGDNNVLYKLSIIHYNDFHARFEETNILWPICKLANAECLGGFPRLYDQITTLKAKKPDAILLNAGDSFQGTYWYNMFKWNITQEFMNLLPHDAHAIGNHEFDDGPEGLVPYLRALKAPVLAANMDTSNEPSFEGTYKPSIIVERNGRKIGIIGLITLDTVDFSSPGNVVFTDPGKATEREAKALTEQGVDIIILLSHCGIYYDIKLAQEYGNYIDVIVGGHTHTLLWNGEAPSKESVAGPYPYIVENSVVSNDKVLIVHASAFTKYIGDLTVYFDDNGKYVNWKGGPIFLNKCIREDSDIKEKLEPYAKLVHKALREPVGRSLINMERMNCYTDCILGQMLADAMVEYAKNYENSSLHYLAFVFSLSIMSDIKKGVITQNDIFLIYPNSDPVLHFEMKGEHIRYVLEAAVTDVYNLNPYILPWFHEVAGFSVTYNMNLPEWKRVTEVRVDNGEPLETDRYYHVLAAKYCIRRTKGFYLVNQHLKNIREIGRDIKILEAYIRNHSPLNVHIATRILMTGRASRFNPLRVLCVFLGILNFSRL